MSQKITGKNLQYDQTLPPFLARLKGQHVADADSPDPILAARRRAAKPRSASEEAEDAPLIVDDDGNVVSGVSVGVDGTVSATTGGGEKEGEEGGGDDDDGNEKTSAAATTTKNTDEEKVAGIGGSKKRKVGKVIGADAEDDQGEDEDRTIKGKGASVKKGESAATSKKDGQDNTKGSGKPKKKAKKIKLSFGDEDGD